MLEALHCLRQNPTQAVELPMACVLKGCEGKDYAAGLCSKHYNRWRITGTFAHGMAKLTDNQVREIRASTLSHRELGRRFGVTHTMVGYIKRRQSWRHIT